MKNKINFLLFSFLLFLLPFGNILPDTPRKFFFILIIIGFSLNMLLTLKRELKYVNKLNIDSLLFFVIVSCFLSYPIIQTNNFNINPLYKYYTLLTVNLVIAILVFSTDSFKEYISKKIFLVFIVYYLIFFIQSFILLDPNEVQISRYFNPNVDIPFLEINLHYGLLSKSINHLSIFISCISSYLVYYFKNKYLKVILSIICILLMLIFHTTLSLFAFLITIIFVNIIVKFQKFTVLFFFIYPYFFTLYSIIIFYSIGITNLYIIGLNGRGLMWGEIISKIPQNSFSQFLFGSGMYANYNEKLNYIYYWVFGKDYFGVKSAHSSSLQLFLDSGLIGYIILYFLITRSLKIYKELNQIPSIAFIVCFLISGLTESLWGPYHFILYIFIIIMIILPLSYTKKYTYNE